MTEKLKNTTTKASPSFERVLQGFVSRRAFLKGSSLTGISSMLGACSSVSVDKNPTRLSSDIGASSLAFSEVSHTVDDTLEVAPSYENQVLISWGDPIFPGIAAFDPELQSKEDQLRRFGYNNDFVGFLPLPLGSESSDHGLLVVNHEYTNTELMFPNSPKGTELSIHQVHVDMAAHGMSVVEIKRDGDEWRVIVDSKYNRRVTPDTPMTFTGHAAGSQRLHTMLSKDGVATFGTYANCSGGVTPWGTVLTGEENVDGHFSGDHSKTPEAENYERFGMRTRYKNWGEFYDRWNLDKNPNELMHAGWVVEIDPYDPHSVPKKRTALGRFKHEGCNVFINGDGKVAAYSGDDQQFEYIYKFISRDTFDAKNPRANLDLLEEGTLYAAKFNEDGSLHWLPLVFGSGPLTEKFGFASQADVLLDTRKAADLLGATPMDRPEDIEVNPANGKVYAMLTNNSARKPDQLNAANPRPHNSHGQIIEFWPASGDHSEEVFSWELFLLAGKPGDTITLYHPEISDKGWLSCPDNCAFDGLGNLWIASDGAEYSGVAEGLWATEVSGKNRALTRRFMRIPTGSEMCGPFFTPDSENLFCSVQHPASGSTFDKPSTRWPDFSDEMPPRPSVVVTRKIGGGRIGS